YLLLADPHTEQVPDEAPGDQAGGGACGDLAIVRTLLDLVHADPAADRSERGPRTRHADLAHRPLAHRTASDETARRHEGKRDPGRPLRQVSHRPHLLELNMSKGRSLGHTSRRKIPHRGGMANPE